MPGIFRRWHLRRTDRDVDEELQFHLSLLTEEHCRQDMSWDDARAAAVERFGNVEQIRDECVNIARGNHPVIIALKWFFGIVFVTGVLVRVFSSEYHFTHVGDVLMAVGVLSRLLLYLRRMTPSSHTARADDCSLIKLNDPVSLSAYDGQKRTPVERLITYK